MPFSITNATHKTQLASELNTDPPIYGYAVFIASGNDEALAALLNKLRDGTDGKAAISVNRGEITSQELIEAIVHTEYEALTATRKQYIDLIAAGQRVRVDTGSTARAGLLAYFGAGTTTRANLTAVSSRIGSRAEQLWGITSTISHSDVAVALGRG